MALRDRRSGLHKDTRPLNAFSVDVEDYFQVEAFSKDISARDWPNLDSRVAGNTRTVLDMLGRYGVRATFFVVGWVAERFPEIVREIKDQGHEVGCHSYWHRLVYSLSPEEFSEDTKRAKHAVEAAGEVEVVGYRAPTFSITRRSLWALDVLADNGFTFDSSIFPIAHDSYGYVRSPTAPYEVTCGSGGEKLAEFPISTFRFFGRRWPVAGGGYLRMLPLWYNVGGIDRIHRTLQPFMLYMHPWEVDPGQPRIPTRLKSRIRHYTNLGRMQRRLEYLLERYRFAPVGEILRAVPLTGFVIDPRRRELIASAAVA